MEPAGTRSAHPSDTGNTGVDLVLDDVSVEVDGREILRKIGFSAQVSRLGVVGRNGSGKSTLARVIAGLLKPTSGTVRVDGLDLARDRKAALREVGVLFQNPDHQIIFPTVLEEVTFGLRQLGRGKREAEADALATLAEFRKSHWADAHVSALSQGQRHLVCMMSILAMRPRLIVLDEPFSGLDIPTRMQLGSCLDTWHGALIHVTHDPSDLDGYDHVVWMEKGMVTAEGTPETLLPRYISAMTELGGTDDISELSR